MSWSWRSTSSTRLLFFMNESPILIHCAAADPPAEKVIPMSLHFQVSAAASWALPTVAVLGHRGRLMPSRRLFEADNEGFPGRVIDEAFIRCWGA